MVFVYNTIQYNTIQCNTIQYNTIHNFALKKVPEQGILFGFSTPEQGGKFKTPVADTRLINVEFPPPRVFRTLNDKVRKHGTWPISRFQPRQTSVNILELLESQE